MQEKHLTLREAQVADLIVLGKSNSWIASELGISDGAVKEYMHRIFTKLELRNRTELAMWVVKRRS